MIEHVWDRSTKTKLGCIRKALLLCFFTIFFTFSSHAFETSPYLRENIARALHGKAQTCPKLNPSKSEYIFLFEGAWGFCPLKSFVFFPHGYDGIWLKDKEDLAAYLMWKEQKQSFDHEEFVENLQLIESRLFFESNWRNCALLRAMSDRIYRDADLDKNLSNYLLQNKKQYLYYSHHGAKEAAACAESLVKQAKAAHLESPRMRAIGYSLGGFTALKFSKKLHRKKIPLHSVLTIDPVPGSFRVATGFLWFKDNKVFDVRHLKTSWTNIYEKSDTRSPFNFKLFGIRGSKVIGAQNTLLDKNDFFDTEAHPSRGHVKIFQSIRFQQVLSLFMTQ